ncbi:hypothetical protein [Tenacibaculum amylolyticum]|uniref:hypothetical protein n=1 Tax=Tenacibaculum amylolyticum TaxID=104269 RepID=UPI003894197A
MKKIKSLGVIALGTLIFTLMSFSNSSEELYGDSKNIQYTISTDYEQADQSVATPTAVALVVTRVATRQVVRQTARATARLRTRRLIGGDNPPDQDEDPDDDQTRALQSLKLRLLN